MLLAKALKRPFLDTDLLLQTQEGLGLQEMIDRDGMEAFLFRESRLICGLNVQGSVVATGGSVVYRKEAMAHLRAHGTCVFLQLSLAEIEARLRNIATRGVARRSGQTLAELYAERQPLYCRYADYTLDVNGLAMEEVVTRLVEMLE
ncbi:MAG TPA: shikimate kinase, partial [Armatimonadota bacterium]